jgi:hypothetical protein
MKRHACGRVALGVLVIGGLLLGGGVSSHAMSRGGFHGGHFSGTGFHGVAVNHRVFIGHRVFVAHGHFVHHHAFFRPCCFGPHFFFGVGVAAPFWYPWYPYPYPVYAPPVVAESSPPVYLQQDLQPQQQYWYYCQGSQAYYPYVKECPGGWVQVAPQPSPPSP